jgi:hypothetical protein
MPLLCALAHPCPGPGVRLFPALLFGGLMIIPFVSIVLMQLRPPRKYRNGLLRTSFAALISLALVGIGAALFAGGFALGF